MKGQEHKIRQTLVPSVIGGWMMIVFSLFILLDGFFPVNEGTIFLGIALTLAGWFWRRAGIKAGKNADAETWCSWLLTRWPAFLSVGI